MGDTPCGCDLALAADDEADSRARDVLTGDAARAQRAWACPHAGHRGDPDPSTRAAVDAVARLVGAEPGEITGCPGACVRRPEAHEGLLALRWWKQGQLQLRCPWPSAAMVEAIDLIDTSVSSREAAELRDARKSRGSDGSH
jgi:hypothetical protein